MRLPNRGLERLLVLQAVFVQHLLDRLGAIHDASQLLLELPPRLRTAHAFSLKHSSGTWPLKLSKRLLLQRKDVIARNGTHFLRTYC